MLRRLLGMLTQGNAKETSIASVAQGLAVGGITVVDVRGDDEWQDGHIRGAIHIPLGSLQASAGTLDRSKPVVTVCRSGMRSLRGADILMAAGFDDVKSMAGGMKAWQSAGQPVTK
jgi:hydroxyacylglutathione hydrolase